MCRLCIENELSLKGTEQEGLKGRVVGDEVREGWGRDIL